MNKQYFFLIIILSVSISPIAQSFKLKIESVIYNVRRLATIVVASTTVNFFNPTEVHAGMLTFPLPVPLKNNIILVRSGESFADSRHEIQTNPVKKLRQDNALTAKGREQAIDAAKIIESYDFLPTYIWTSNTERAYETASIIAKEFQLGQNRIVPEYSFLDARAVGEFEGKNDESSWRLIHERDRADGIKYKPRPNNDGTPSESVSDVLVRGNQLVSTIESMYSGENVVIVSPDGDVLSVLQAALYNENPDDSLPQHAQFDFSNGEARRLSAFVKASDRLYTGQTVEEASANSRKIKALRVSGSSDKEIKLSDDSWMDLWHVAIDIQQSS